MSDMQTERALMELLGKPARSSPAGFAASVTAVGGEAVASELAADIDAGDDAPPRRCDDLYATHDLAALREGHLSPDGIHRLARHVTTCATCKILVATIVAEASRAESTGTHPAAPERQPEQRQR
jgi:hypothetical protein